MLKVNTIHLDGDQTLVVEAGDVELVITVAHFGAEEPEPYLLVRVPGMNYAANIFLHESDTDQTVIAESGFALEDGDILQELSGPFEFMVAAR